MEFERQEATIDDIVSAVADKKLLLHCYSYGYRKSGVRCQSDEVGAYQVIKFCGFDRRAKKIKQEILQYDGSEIYDLHCALELVCTYIAESVLDLSDFRFDIIIDEYHNSDDLPAHEPLLSVKELYADDFPVLFQSLISLAKRSIIPITINNDTVITEIDYELIAEFIDLLELTSCEIGLFSNEGNDYDDRRFSIETYRASSGSPFQCRLIFYNNDALLVGRITKTGTYEEILPQVFGRQFHDVIFPDCDCNFTREWNEKEPGYHNENSWTVHLNIKRDPTHEEYGTYNHHEYTWTECDVRKTLKRIIAMITCEFDVKALRHQRTIKSAR